MFAACPVRQVPALAAPRRPRRRSRCPFGNSCNDTRRQKLVLRRPNSVLCHTSSHPRSSFYPSYSPETLPPLKPERLLCRSRWLNPNAFQREHPDLGRRAAWRGKPTNLAPRRKDPVARDHQRHRILGHGLADIARGFRSGAEFLRQCAIGRCATPSDPSSRGVDALKEWVQLAEVELEHGKIRLLAFEIAPYSATASATSGMGAPGFAPGIWRSRVRSVALALFVGNWKRVMPALFQAIPQKPPAVSKMRKWSARPTTWPSHFALPW